MSLMTQDVFVKKEFNPH